MKANLFILSLMLLFTLASCNPSTEMLTVVNPDGSCYREIYVTPDSTYKPGDTDPQKNPFPVVINENWKVQWVDSTSRLLSARQEFPSVESMDSLFQLKESHPWHQFKVKHRLNEKFRWFYTYYDYSETYPQIVSEIELPIDSFMSHDEMMYWFTGQPNLMHGMNGIEAREYLGKIEDSYNHWFSKNAWYAHYKELLNHYDQLSNFPLTKDKLTNLRDSIYKTKVNQDVDFNMNQVLNDFFNTTAFNILWKDENSAMRQFEENYLAETIEYFEGTFHYKLILPGTIIDAGNATINGDTLHWKLDAYRMYPSEYTLHAKSRKANVWIFFISGLIVLIAAGSFFVKTKK